MAFTGVAVVKQVSDGLVRITGVSLQPGQAGTIGLFEKTVAPGVRMPEAFKPRPYDPPYTTVVSLQDSIEVTFNYAGAANNENPVSVVKSGSTPQDFLVTMTNTDAGEGDDTGLLEIYVRHH